MTSQLRDIATQAATDVPSTKLHAHAESQKQTSQHT